MVINGKIVSIYLVKGKGFEFLHQIHFYATEPRYVLALKRKIRDLVEMFLLIRYNEYIF